MLRTRLLESLKVRRFFVLDSLLISEILPSGKKRNSTLLRSSVASFGKGLPSKAWLMADSTEPDCVESVDSEGVSRSVVSREGESFVVSCEGGSFVVFCEGGSFAVSCEEGGFVVSCEGGSFVVFSEA